MKITKVENGEELILKLSGELEMLQSSALENEVKNTPENVKKLVLDFEDVEYISSAGVRTILEASKFMSGKGGKLILKKLNDNVIEILKMASLLDLLDIEN